MAKLNKLVIVVDEFVEICGRMSCARNFDHTIALKVAIDVVSLDCRFNLVHVLEAKVFEQTNLIRKPLLRVGDSVRQARVHEAAVASACSRPNLVCLN